MCVRLGRAPVLSDGGIQEDERTESDTQIQHNASSKFLELSVSKSLERRGVQQCQWLKSNVCSCRSKTYPDYWFDGHRCGEFGGIKDSADGRRAVQMGFRAGIGF